jgi:hypothetical protein
MEAMTRVRVIADDGWVALDESAGPDQLSCDHYRRCLADRLAWAVADAQTRAEPPEAHDVFEEREAQPAGAR